MLTRLTVSDLRNTGKVSDDAIDAMADAYLVDPNTARFRLDDGRLIDVAAAFAEYAPAQLACADRDRTAKFKRKMVRTAILLAHLVKG